MASQLSPLPLSRMIDMSIIWFNHLSSQELSRLPLFSLSYSERFSSSPQLCRTLCLTCPQTQTLFCLYSFKRGGIYQEPFDTCIMVNLLFLVQFLNVNLKLWIVPGNSLAILSVNLLLKFKMNVRPGFKFPIYRVLVLEFTQSILL